MCTVNRVVIWLPFLSLDCNTFIMPNRLMMFHNGKRTVVWLTSRCYAISFFRNKHSTELYPYSPNASIYVAKSLSPLPERLIATTSSGLNVICSSTANPSEVHQDHYHNQLNSKLQHLYTNHLFHNHFDSLHKLGNHLLQGPLRQHDFHLKT